MTCRQCQGLEDLFSRQFVSNELAQYRRKGPAKTTRMLTEALKAVGVKGYSLLDIGGGLGAIQHDLLAAGVEQAEDVDASSAYLSAAAEEARRRGLAGRIRYHHGNFVDIAPEIQPADVVTLDRVICCYPDMEKLVILSAERARKLYGLVYPRDTWWIKLGQAVMNFVFGLQRSSYRSYSHPSRAVEALLESRGLTRRFYRQTLVWQVAVYAR